MNHRVGQVSFGKLISQAQCMDCNQHVWGNTPEALRKAFGEHRRKHGLAAFPDGPKGPTIHRRFSIHEENAWA